MSPSREMAELLARVVDARARGQEVLVIRRHAEVTPSVAAELLGMSRPQVRLLMYQGVLDFRKVDAHHRIRVASIRAFLEAERPQRRGALGDLADLQNELGLNE